MAQSIERVAIQTQLLIDISPKANFPPSSHTLRHLITTKICHSQPIIKQPHNIS